MEKRSCNVKSCDLLIVGGGGSGAIAAIEASENADIKIIVASRGPIGKSGLTPTGNGGTAGTAPEEQLFEEMVKAGRFLNDQNLVELMATKAKGCLEKLKTLGVSVIPFRPGRVCVPGPETLRILRKKMIDIPNIELLEDVFVTRLLKDRDRVCGVTAIDIRTGEFFVIKAKGVIIATGGMTGELYPRTSNNPFGITTGASGTGHIMAFHLGAEIVDPEMIQFVPLPAGPQNLNIRYFPEFWNGPYMNRFDEVVESDVNRYYGASYSWQVIRSLFVELREGRGPIYIDRRDVPLLPVHENIKAWALRRRLIKAMGIDPRGNRFEICLGSHFCMGGIRVNEKTETAVPGLYAAGEVIGGLHGALRIQGYSFTQMIVFGFEAGRNAAAWVSKMGTEPMIDKEEIEKERQRVYGFLDSKKAFPVDSLKGRLKKLMEAYVFVERDAEGLKKAIGGIKEIKEEASSIKIPDFKRFNLEWIKALELQSIVEAADLVAKGALLREETRGFQWRSDFPGEDNKNWLCHTVFTYEDGDVGAGKAPVVITRMRPEV